MQKATAYSFTALAFMAAATGAQANLTLSGVPANLKVDNGTATITAMKPIDLPNTTLLYQIALLQFNFATFGLSFSKYWTVANAGNFKGTLDVAKYVPTVVGIKGSLQIQINYKPANPASPPPIAGAAKGIPTSPAIANTTNLNGKAIWIQDVFTNAPGSGANGLFSPYPDTITGAVKGNQFQANGNNGPLYPYQYNGSYFYDKPWRNANAFWMGDAFLASANFATHSLTVYEGVEWGFSVVKDPPAGGGLNNGPDGIDIASSTPGPAAMAPFAIGLVGLLKRRIKS